MYRWEAESWLPWVAFDSRGFSMPRSTIHAQRGQISGTWSQLLARNFFSAVWFRGSFVILADACLFGKIRRWIASRTSTTFLATDGSGSQSKWQHCLGMKSRSWGPEKTLQIWNEQFAEKRKILHHFPDEQKGGIFARSSSVFYDSW